jgi:hypothetical protein
MLDLLKIKVVLEFPVPTSITNVRAFLGLIGYNQNYIKGYAKIVTQACLVQTRKDVELGGFPSTKVPLKQQRKCWWKHQSCIA